MSSGELLTRWTVRAALAFYVLSLSLRIAAARRPSRLKVAHLLWIAGCVAFLLHTAAAFHFYHHWSHAAAYIATARQTAEVTGLDWGGGLYANYVFAVLWTADACWWSISPASYLARRRTIEWAVQGFLGFIAFNATVVFGAGAIRWIGVAACLYLAVALQYARVVRAAGQRTRVVQTEDG